MFNNVMRPVPVTIMHSIQAGSIGSHGNIPPLPSAGLPITSRNLPTNVGTVSRPGIGVRPIATPILARGRLQHYPANPGIRILPVGVRPIAPVVGQTPHWGQT